ncbi:MAG: PAS domain S-box protein [Burkholderiaceae bacterium]|nr:PAS domain S-box protein [Burkholderiaceae bacterium]
MQSARERDNEAACLAALHALEILDTAPEPEFDALTRAAALLCGTPIALISLADRDRQWLKSSEGLPGVTEVPRGIGLCSYSILCDDLFEVADAACDPRFSENPLVTGEPGIRFYAGAPLRLANGLCVGALCVIDRQPRHLDETQRELLRCLAQVASQALDARQAIHGAQQTLDQLAESEQRFRTLSDSSPLGIYYTDAAGACCYTNERWQEIFGMSLEDSLGCGWARTLHPDDATRVQAEWSRCVAKGREFNLQFNVLLPSGKVHRVDSRARAVCGADGAVTGYVGSAEDVTRHHALLAQLSLNEDRLRRLYEATPAMLHSIDAKGRLLSVSDTWLAKLGYSRDEVIGRPSADFLSSASREHALSVVLPAFFQSGRVDNISYQMVTRSGGLMDVRLSSILERDSAGCALRSLAVIEDVTLHRIAERALTTERQRLTNLVEGTHAGTWEWQVQSGEVHFNERWAQIIGYTLAELEPLSIQSWMARGHPDDLVRSTELLAQHFAGQIDHYECETRRRHRDGHWVWVLARGRVITWTPDGKPEWMYGTHLDISHRKREEEALRKSERFLDRTGKLAGVGGWEVDLQSKTVFWSDETCRIHGMSPGHRPTVHEAIDFYAPEARDMIRQAVESASAGGAGFELELPLFRSDGKQIWVHVVGSVECVDGKPRRLVGAFQDVTQQVAERLALSEARERAVLATDSGGIGIWDWDLRTRVLLWDARMFRLFGSTQDEGIDPGVLWCQRVHREDMPAVDRAIQSSIDNDVAFDTEFRIVWPDGSVHHLRAAARVTRDAQGTTLRMVGTNWDVTEQRRLASDLVEQHERLRVTLRSIGDAVITADAEGCVSWLNPVAERLTGWTSAEARGHSLSKIYRTIDEESGEANDSPVTTCLTPIASRPATQKTLLLARNGEQLAIEDSASPICNDQGDMLGVVLVFRDVSAQRKMVGEISYRATHDDLTGLVNRAEFETRLSNVLKKSHDDGGENAVLFIDLDQFKLVNDACGHSVGDQLLQQAAKLFGNVIRASDTLARLGGDEFAIILERCNVEQAQRVAQKICAQMDDYRFFHDGRRFRVGASIGLVPVDNRWDSISAILQAADTSCYAAKEAGRNRVHVWFDSDLAMRARHGEMQWTTRIEQALDQDGFVLHAQRIDPLGDAPCGLHAEVLLRMVDSDGSLIPPGAFLPAAERFHLASRIDRWVLSHAISWMAALPDLRVLSTLNVNLSGQSVGDRAFHRWAVDLLTQAGPAVCQRLCLEITETSAVTHLADAGAFIEQVRAAGIRVALDDFGSGASSFGYLKRLPVDLLKIDGQFICNLVGDPLSLAAVRCFIDVAKVMGLKTVAEFVENAEVMEQLRTMGVDYAQGYLIHRPEPIDRLLGVIAVAVSD